MCDMNYWLFFVLLYLGSAVAFSQIFKISNRGMKDATCMTLLLEGITSLFALLFIPFFPLKVSHNLYTYLILLIVGLFYALIDRLNIEARYGLEPSAFSMLKQLSTVFIIVFGILFMNEGIIWYKIVGAFLIVFANLILSFKKGKFVFDKYYLMSVVANILFGITMLININLSSEFNIAVYTFLTVFIPFVIIKICTKKSFKDLKKEFNRYDKQKFVISSFMWSLMLLSSVKAYELGSILMVASFLSLTSILNSIVEFVIKRDIKLFWKNILLGILIVIGVILVKL